MSPEYFRSDRRDERRAAVAQIGHKFQTHLTISDAPPPWLSHTPSASPRPTATSNNCARISRPAIATRTTSTSMADARVVDREERDFLVRLFAWAPAGRTDSRRRTRSAHVAVTAAPLPRDVFKLVVSFWRPDREWWWSD